MRSQKQYTQALAKRLQLASDVLASRGEGRQLIGKGPLRPRNPSHSPFFFEEVPIDVVRMSVQPPHLVRTAVEETCKLVKIATSELLG